MNVRYHRSVTNYVWVLRFNSLFLQLRDGKDTGKPTTDGYACSDTNNKIIHRCTDCICILCEIKIILTIDRFYDVGGLAVKTLVLLIGRLAV